MITIINFDINKNKRISLIVPDAASKINYFYEPSENLHKFDQATAYLKIAREKPLKIGKNSLDDFLYSLNANLKKALSYKLILPNTLEAQNVGLVLNNYLNDRLEIQLEPFWLWSGKKPYTFTLMYNADNKIYIEVVPIYPWTFREHEGKDYIPFEQWMKNYKPYAVETISPLTAMQWLQKSEEYLKLIECEP